MQFYSHYFSTLHDEEEPVGSLGGGTHYSVLRAVLWLPEPKFHDFAVIWDADHDRRIVWVVEQMYVRRLLEPVLAIGERKGGVTVLTDGTPTEAYAREVETITTNVPSDSFSSSVERFDDATGMIINASEDRVRAFLGGIRALWDLGTKPCQFCVEPFRLPTGLG